MRRLRTFASEVEDCGDERLAEMPGPDVVDRDAGRERVLSIGEPVRQCRPSAGAGGREWLEPGFVRFEVVFLCLEGASRDDVRIDRILERLDCCDDCGLCRVAL